MWGGKLGFGFESVVLWAQGLGFRVRGLGVMGKGSRFEACLLSGTPVEDFFRLCLAPLPIRCMGNAIQSRHLIWRNL